MLDVRLYHCRQPFISKTKGSFTLGVCYCICYCVCNSMHSCTVHIGGSRGAPPVRAPQGSTFFCFDIQIFLKHSHLGSWHPPYEDGAPLREILDPPLVHVLLFTSGGGKLQRIQSQTQMKTICVNGPEWLIDSSGHLQDINKVICQYEIRASHLGNWRM